MKERVAEIVAAYVGHHTVSADQLPTLIASVDQALNSLGQTPAPAPVLTPAVAIRRSVGDETITCLDCGWKGSMVKRHLTTAHGLTPEQYREKWGLDRSYPLVAKNYASRRSELAKKIGLGKRRGRR
jgi:predicted transcriptional regulator